MIKLEMKNDNLVLTEKQGKYQHYHVEKLINMMVQKYCPLIKDK